MSIEYLPVGIACNLKCEYCYQDPMRDAGNINSAIDWSRAKEQLTKENYRFTVFGGEPLLAPISHLEEVFKFGLERFGGNGIQTNGGLITDAHIGLFRDYRVSVGLSLDGPDLLNSARCDLETTQAIHRNLESLCWADVIPSIIVTLNKHNGSWGKQETLCRWFDYLESLGIRHINVHLLEMEKGREGQALTDEENILAMSHIYEFAKTSKMTFLPFADIRRMLTENSDNCSCVWNSCDPLTTDAVHGVGPDGTRSNCGRTNKDGVNWVKADKAGSERYLLLQQVPQEFGGCKDCDFFLFCKGQCPGTAIDGDWRNRTAHCKVWYALFEMVERDILLERRLPLSRNTTALKKLHQKLNEQWLGTSSTDQNHGDAHGDSPHGDAPHGDAHGDAPHGDTHGDSGKSVEVSWR